MYLLFDGSFDGLLTAAAWSFRNGRLPVTLVSALDPPTLLETVPIQSEAGIHGLFQRHFSHVLGRTAGAEVLDTAWRAFLSERCGIASEIVRYLELALHTRRNPSGRLCDKPVAAVVEAARYAGGQAHAYLGLLRFRLAAPEFYIADFKPDCQVLPLVLPHFCDRLPDQNFAIRDLCRHQAALHLADGRTGLFRLADDPGGLLAGNLPEIVSSLATDEYEPMWQTYLQHLSIPERRNPRLQITNMPKKYWEFLVEQPDSGQRRPRGQ